MHLEKTAWGGWPNCYRLGNGTVDLIVTTDIGPRVMSFGFTGEGNQFFENTELLGKMGGADYRSYGGHRLWHAPEARPRTTQPDNDPVETQALHDGLHLKQPVEAATGIQKEIDLHLGGGSSVHVVHRLRNAGLWPVELAPWGLSVMAPGGVAIIPLPPRAPHPQNLLPNTRIALWPYTNLADPRWRLGHRYILLRQDAAATLPQKIGAAVPNGWCAYVRNGVLFVKKFRFDPAATYPDLGVSVEIFTNAKMLELETLGPLARLDPGACVEYSEHWQLHRNAPLELKDDDHVDRAILSLVTS